MPMSPRLLRPRAAAATGFDPRAIGSLNLWLDASDLSTLFDATTGGAIVNDGSPVARWEDKSGNARHATESTANNRPLRRATSQNGRGGLEFDGVNDSLQTAAFQQSPSFTIFIVHRFTQNVANNTWNFGRVIEAGSNNGWSIVKSGNSGIHPYAVQYSSNTTGINYTQAVNTSAALLRYSAGAGTLPSLSFSVNAVAAVTGTATVQMPTSALSVVISRFGGGGFFTPQVVNEILIYPFLLSGSQDDTVREYLRTKWAVY